MKKRYLLLGLILFCLFNLNVNASTKTNERTESNLLLPTWLQGEEIDKTAVLNTKAVDANEKIYDFADYITDQDEAKLYSYIMEYKTHTGYDLVLLTTDNLDGKKPFDYMYNFYDYNSFDRNGIIMLVYKNKYKSSIYIGTTKFGDDSKIEEVYTKAYIKGMVDYLKDLFNNKEYYKGFNDFIKLGIGIYDIQMNNNGNYRVDADGKLVKNIYWVDYLVLSLAITSIIVVVLLYLNSINNKKVIVKDYLNKSTLIVNKVSEEGMDEPEK